MTDNFNGVSWPVTWSKFARKQIFIPKRLDSMFGRALVPGWRPFMNKVYIREYFPIFKTAPVGKRVWRIINTIASIWGENILEYLSLAIICSSKLTVFLEVRSKKTVRFSKLISRQMEAIFLFYFSFKIFLRF